MKAVLASAALVVSVAACTAEEDEPRSAPQGTAFYTPPKDLSEFAHGDLIWSRELEGAMGLAQSVPIDPRPGTVPPLA